MSDLESLPGFRRRIVIVPAPGRVSAAVEDDYHCMRVTIAHDGTTATAVTGEMFRVPWTTCPGAAAVLARTFNGVPLAHFGRHGDKRANCTHLNDLAIWAAAHANDSAPLTYDVLISDPVDGRQRAELRRDGAVVLEWVVDGMTILAPDILAGRHILQINDWIATLDEAGKEQARILRWGVMLAHGRGRSYEGVTDLSKLPAGQCFTFQPEQLPAVKYKPETVRDFSGRDGDLLAGLEGAYRIP